MLDYLLPRGMGENLTLIYSDECEQLFFVLLDFMDEPQCC